MLSTTYPIAMEYPSSPATIRVLVWAVIVIGLLYALVNRNDIVVIALAFLGIALLSRRYRDRV